MTFLADSRSKSPSQNDCFHFNPNRNERIEAPIIAGVSQATAARPAGRQTKRNSSKKGPPFRQENLADDKAEAPRRPPKKKRRVNVAATENGALRRDLKSDAKDEGPPLGKI